MYGAEVSPSFIDRGYLEKVSPSTLPTLARIDACRAGVNKAIRPELAALVISSMLMRHDRSGGMQL